MQGGYYGRNFGRGRFYAAGKRGLQAGYGGFGLRLSTEYIAGIIIGMTNYDKQIPAEIKLAAAVAPITGLGKVKGFAQGLVLGDLIQNKMGYTIGGGAPQNALSY